MTNFDFGSWQVLITATVVALAALLVAYRLADRWYTARQSRLRVAAARVRAGHVPQDIPTTRGGLGGRSRFGPSTQPHSQWDLDEAPEERVVVDEQPRIHIRYTDIHGKLAECTIRVEKLDLHRQAIISRAESIDDIRVYPLSRIHAARNAANGRPFNLGTWVDAVRVARRRRESHEAPA